MREEEEAEEEDEDSLSSSLFARILAMGGQSQTTQKHYLLVQNQSTVPSRAVLAWAKLSSR